MGTKVNSNYEDLITFTRASGGHALRPVSYGDELVTNGTFDDNIDNWTDDNTEGTISYNSAGAMDLARNSGTGISIATQTISTLTVGKLYEVSFDVTAVSGAVRMRFDDQIFTTSPNHTAGVFSFSFVATVSSSVLTIDLRNSATSTATIDNISVREVLFDQPDGTLTLFEHPDDVPRVEYDADGNRLGLLVEESRTNLERYSDFSSDWASLDSTEVQNAIAPDGTETAFTVTRDSTSYGGFFFYNAGTNISVTSGSTYSISIYLKQGEMGNVTSFLLKPDNSGVGGSVVSGAVTITPQTDGSFSLSDDFDASSESVGNGWYRVSLSFTATTTGTAQYGLVSSGSSNFPLNSSILVWGAQFEAGSFPTSYIKTTGSTATRSADVASIPVADFGWNNGAGTVVVKSSIISPQTSQYNAFVQLVEDTNNRIDLGVLVNDGWQSIRTGGVDTAKYYTDGHNANIFDAGEVAITALAFSPTSTNSSANGSLGTEDTSSALPTAIQTLKIGVDHTSRYANGHIKSIKYYPRRLSDAQLQELTS